MVVTVFYDPENPIYSHNANLKHLENGGFGSFYR